MYFICRASDAVPAVQAQRRSKEHSRSTSALSGMADEKSELSQDADHHMSLYSNGFMTSSIGNDSSRCSKLQNAQRSDQQTGALSVDLYLFVCPPAGYQTAKTVELQQRSSSVATQQTTVSSIPSHPSTTGVSSTCITHTSAQACRERSEKHKVLSCGSASHPAVVMKGTKIQSLVHHCS